MKPPTTSKYPLTEANDKFCVYFAKRLFLRLRPRRLGFSDFVQAARLGMLLSEPDYSPKRGTKFITYAAQRMYRQIESLFNDHETAVRIPIQSYHRKSARVPMVEIDGLVKPEYGSDQHPDPADRLPALQHTDPEPTHLRDIAIGLAPLTDQQQLVLIHRAAGRTLAAIGADLGLSRERIRQIGNAALETLKQRRPSLMPTSTRRRTEQRIQTEIRREFGSKPWCRLWRQNTGRVRSDTGRWIELAPPGAADLTGLLADGRRFEIEVKSSTGQQSQEQRNFEAMIRKLGGVYILARSVDDVYRGLADAGFDPPNDVAA